MQKNTGSSREPYNTVYTEVGAVYQLYEDYRSVFYKVQNKLKNAV
jgi:hypothetical protein